MRTIEHLVFKGGGVLGIAYAGAIQALDDNQLLEPITGAAGTSAGSIVAALVALKYSSAEIKEIVQSTNFKKFESGFNPLRIPTKYGLYNGDYFLEWLQDRIKDKTGNPNITFRELKEQNYRDLRVFATDLNEQNVKEFSYEKTPDVVVAYSVRASMSIPLFFEAWKFPNNNPDDHVYVDGGTVYNYPINAFEDLSKTLGFFLYDKQETVNDLDYDHLLKYVKVLFSTLMNSQNIDFDRDSEEHEITVKIDDLGISAVDFDITDAQEKSLYDSGYNSTRAYIEASQSQT